ncbi:MAG: hypothetical protein HQ579_04755 [Candidatus Omnitrophica bacterium]|nr:hypothetical protein [Candidatus Omnitrophota bacterium]
MERAKKSRNELMLIAKDRGIKNFRILNKEELGKVLRDNDTDDDIQKVVNGAVDRWKSGWGSKKVKNES